MSRLKILCILLFDSLAGVVSYQLVDFFFPVGPGHNPFLGSSLTGVLLASLFLQNLYQLRSFADRRLLFYKVFRAVFFTGVFSLVLVSFGTQTGMMLDPFAVVGFFVIIYPFLLFFRGVILPDFIFPFLSRFFPKKFLNQITWVDDGTLSLDISMYFDIKKSFGSFVNKKINLCELEKNTLSVDDFLCVTANIETVDALVECIGKLVQYNKPILIFAPILDKLPIADPWIEINGRHALYIANTKPKIGYYIVQRVVDCFLSVIVLLFLAPVWGLVSLLIKMTSKGAILFKQSRVGLHEKSFTCLKFRTMTTGADDQVHRTYLKGLIEKGDQFLSKEGEDLFKIKGDDRVTRLGAFLRKVSLDEVPQFINVLEGSMSIVGPRPSIGYEVDQYKTWYRRRFDVKPGLTGVWQVFGRSSIPFDAAMFLDFYYTLNRSFLSDIRLILKTAPVVLLGKGGY